MLKEFLTIYSNCDGLPLSTAIFIPEEEVKGIVQISHGMAEHKERYFSFMEYLTERNYVVVINDHRGHGESVRDKNDLGYFYDESGEYIVKDLHQITLYMNAWLSSDENNVQNYDSDDLCGFIFTLNGFRNLFLLMKEIYITSGWALKNKDLPIMFIAGRDDPVIVSEDKWNESREFLKKLGYTNVRGKLYKGLRHEILNENIKENIYDDIVKFMLE